MSKQETSQQDQTPNRRLWEAVSFNRANENRPMNERLEDIRRAARDGADLNMVENYKYPTPLIWAALHGDHQLEILVELVNLGADLHFDLSEKAPISSYDNAFQAALYQDQYKAASLLLDLGADVNADPADMEDFLISKGSFTAKDVEMAKKMIRAGAVCGDGVLEILQEQWNGGYLVDTEDYFDDNSLRMVHLLEIWLAERAAQAMDAVLPPAAENPSPHARRF